jgi:hypothetical protein
MMSKQEIVGELSHNQGNWLFVDGQMVDASTLENTSITQDNVLRMVPSIVGGSDEATFTVKITNSSGHSVAQMSQTELACETESGSNWLFVDGQMVDATAVREMDLSQAAEIRLTKPLVGGIELL